MLRTGVLWGGLILVFLAGATALSYAGEDISLEKVSFVEETSSEPADMAGDAEPVDGVYVLDEGEMSRAVSGAVYGASQAPWEFKVNAFSSFTYDTNYTRKPHDPKSEAIYGVGPVFTLVRKHSSFKTNFRYAPTYKKYVHHPRNDKLDHNLTGTYQYRSGSVYISGAESMVRTSQGGTSEDTTRSKIFSNSLTNEVGWDCSEKVSLALRHNYTRYTYLDVSRKGNSYQVQGIGPRIYYHIRPTVDLYLQHLYSFYDYYNSGQGDSKDTVTAFGVRGRLREDTVLQAEVGVESRNYDNSSSSDQEGFWVEGVLQRKLSRKTSLNLSAKRALQESSLQGVNSYEATTLSSSLSYRYSPRTSGALSLSWQNNDYSQETTVTDPDTGVTTTAKRSDDIYSAGLSLKYLLRENISFDSSLSCSRKSSNFQQYEYDDQIVTLSAHYAF